MASVAVTATFGLGTKKADAAGQVTVGVTETIASFNPYADSISMGYAIWCQVYGCLGLYDYEKEDYVGTLAERWEIDKNDKNIWTFHLKHGVKRQHDGKEFTAEDVVHSVNRINTDPQSKQKQNTSPIKEIVALDKYTVKIVTKEPTASLLEFIFDRVIITGKDLYDKHGARDADATGELPGRVHGAVRCGALAHASPRARGHPHGVQSVAGQAEGQRAAARRGDAAGGAELGRARVRKW